MGWVFDLSGVPRVEGGVLDRSPAIWRHLEVIMRKFSFLSDLSLFLNS